MSTLVDSNVLIDILQPDSVWLPWSSRQLKARREHGLVVINHVIAAEVASGYINLAIVQAALSAPIWQREDIPWAAAFLAGVVHGGYRRKGGRRERVLPDFLIGAHAMVGKHALLTRDARRYRTYFPELDVIAPDTHP